MKSFIKMHKFLIAAFCTILSLSGAAQSKQVDSLLKLLDTETADSNRLKIYNSIGNYYMDNNAGKAIEYFKNAIEISEKLNQPLAVADNQYRIGYCYMVKGDFDKSLENYLLAVRIYEALKDSLHLSKVLMSVAIVYSENKDFKKTNEYHDKAQLIIEGIKDRSQLSELFNERGIIYDQRGLYDTALQYLQHANKIAIALNDDYLIADVLSNIGLTYKHQKKPTEALKCFDSVLVLFKKNETQLYRIASLYNNIAATHAQAGSYTLAKDAFSKSISIAMEAGIPDIIMENYRNLSDMYGDTKNFEQQANYLKKYYTIKDSLFTADNKNQLTQLEADYHIEQKNREIAKKEGEVEKQKSQRNIFISIALAAALLLTALGIFYGRIKKKNQLLEEKNIQINKQRDELQNALHDLKNTQSQLIQSEKMASLGELTAGIAHEIQNPLNFVNNFSDVSTELVDEMNTEIDKGNLEDAKQIAQDLKQNLEKINHHGKRAGDIVKGMLQHSRSSSGIKEPTDINALADEYLRLAYHGLRAKDKSFNATMKTDFDENIENINIIPQDIGRAVLNLITNAFYAVTEKNASALRQAQNKPGSAGQQYEPTVTVSTKKINARPDDPVGRGKVEIRVRDNGNGIPQKILDKIFQPFFTTKPTGQGTGLGLSLSYDIVKAHGGELNVTTEEGKGSEFIIQLPNTKQIS